jgi:hypothetical protein
MACLATRSVGGGLISLWLYKENNKLQDWNMYLLYIFPRAPHTYGFVVLTSLTHPRKIILVVLQIGKAKDLTHPYVLQTTYRWMVDWSMRKEAVYSNHMRYPIHFPRRAEEIHEMVVTIVGPTAEVWTRGLLNTERHLAAVGGNMAPQSLLLNGKTRTASDKRRAVRVILLLCRLVSQIRPRLPVIVSRKQLNRDFSDLQKFWKHKGTCPF